MQDRKKKLKEFLEQMYSKQLTDEEVAGHKDRLVKFFGLLVEIDMRNKRKK